MKEGTAAELGDMKVFPKKRGYEVVIGENTYFFGKGLIAVNDDEVDISKESTVLVLQGTTLRRQ